MKEYVQDFQFCSELIKWRSNCMYRISNFVLIHTSTFIQRDPSFQVEIRTLSHSSFLKDQTQKS